LREEIQILKKKKKGRLAPPMSADAEPPARPAAREGEIELCGGTQPLDPPVPSYAFPRSFTLDTAA
jgi:hypothetical protein